MRILGILIVHLGILIGHLVTGLNRVLKSALLLYLLGALAIILSAPWITDYWLSHIHIPDIPLSANIFMVVSTAFLLVFCMSLYLIVQMIRQVGMNQRMTGAPNPFVISAMPGIKATGGDFIPTDDEQLRNREDIEILKRKGILQETDVEGMASEIGHAVLMKNRGRTE